MARRTIHRSLLTFLTICFYVILIKKGADFTRTTLRDHSLQKRTSSKILTVAQKPVKDGSSKILTVAQKPVKDEFSKATFTKKQSFYPCALIFYGALRSFESIAYPSIQKNILDVNPSCHVFAHTYLLQSISTKRNFEFEEIYNVNEIFMLTDNIVVDSKNDFVETRQPSKYYKYFPKNSGWEFPTSLDNMLMAWHSVERAFNLAAAGDTKIYSVVGLFRIDTIYVAPVFLDSASSTNRAPLANTFDSPSLNDRMFIGTWEASKRWATGRFDNVENYMKTATGKKWGLRSENFLHWIMRENTIKIDPDLCSTRVRSTGAISARDRRECEKTNFKDTWPQVHGGTKCIDSKKRGAAYFTYSFGNFRGELTKNKRDFEAFSSLLHEKQIRCFLFTDFIGFFLNDCHVIYMAPNDTTRLTCKTLKFKLHALLETYEYVFSSDFSIHSIRSMKQYIREGLAKTIKQNLQASLFLRRHPQRERVEEELAELKKQTKYQPLAVTQKYEKFLADFDSDFETAPLVWTNVWVLRASDTCFLEKWGQILDTLVEHNLNRDQIVFPHVMRNVEKSKIYYLRNECERYPHPKIGWCTDAVKKKYYNCYPKVC